MSWRLQGVDEAFEVWFLASPNVPQACERRSCKKNETLSPKPQSLDIARISSFKHENKNLCIYGYYLVHSGTDISGDSSDNSTEMQPC